MHPSASQSRRISATIAAGGGAEDRFLLILTLALLLAVGTSLLLGKLKLPPLPGYFLCGVLLAVSSGAAVGADTADRCASKWARLMSGMPFGFSRITNP